jgi:hypothetical protein
MKDTQFVNPIVMPDRKLVNPIVMNDRQLVHPIIMKDRQLKVYHYEKYVQLKRLAIHFKDPSVNTYISLVGTEADRCFSSKYL